MARAGGAAVAPQVHAVEAAVEVLGSGGNAVDAAVAAAFVQGVVDPIMCGPGGYAVLLHWSGTTGRATVVDGSARAGSLVREDQWADIALGPTSDRFGYRVAGNVNEVGYPSIAVPGTVDALGAAHARWGTVPWPRLLERAIDLAATGFTVTASTADFWQRPATEGRTSGPERVRFTPAAARQFAPSGEPLAPGERLVQADHGELLRNLAHGGARAFYEGEIAATMAADVQANGGSITAGDLAAFHAGFLEPMASTYRGLRIIGAPRPFGGAMVARALDTLDGHDVASLGHGTPELIALIADAMNDAGSERAIEGANTTQLCVVDADGDVVSLTHSLGYSSGVVIPTLGFLLNNYMNCFNPLPGHADSIAPGAYRESSMSPTIATSAEGPIIVTGAPGATRIPGAVVQVITNIVDFGMSAVEAVSAPRVDCQGGPIHVEGRIGHAVSAALEGLGHEVERHPANYDRYFGRPQVLVRGERGWDGASDPRGDGASAMLVP